MEAKQQRLAGVKNDLLLFVGDFSELASEVEGFQQELLRDRWIKFADVKGHEDAAAFLFD